MSVPAGPWTLFGAQVEVTARQGESRNTTMWPSQVSVLAAVKRFAHFLVLLLLLATPAGAQWTQVQSEVNTACASGTTCNLTVASTGTGNLIGVSFTGSSGLSNISSVSGGGTYVVCSNCAAANGGTSWSVDQAWTLSSSSGATTITVTLDDASSSWGIAAYEYACTGTKALDASGSTAAQSTSSTPAGQALTLGGSGRLIVQNMGRTTGNFTSISGGYTDHLAGGTTNGSTAVLENTSSGSAPTWTITASSVTNVGAAAFSCTAPATGSGSRRSFGLKK